MYTRSTHSYYTTRRHARTLTARRAPVARYLPHATHMHMYMYGRAFLVSLSRLRLFLFVLVLRSAHLAAVVLVVEALPAWIMSGSWDRPATFSKIFQKFACVNRDLPGQNLPLVERKFRLAPIRSVGRSDSTPTMYRTNGNDRIARIPIGIKLHGFTLRFASRGRAGTILRQTRRNPAFEIENSIRDSYARPGRGRPTVVSRGPICTRAHTIINVQCGIYGSEIRRHRAVQSAGPFRLWPFRLVFDATKFRMLNRPRYSTRVKVKTARCAVRVRRPTAQRC